MNTRVYDQITKDLQSLITKYEKKADQYKEKINPRERINLVEEYEKAIEYGKEGNTEKFIFHKKRYDKAIKSMQEPIEKIDKYIQEEIFYRNCIIEIQNIIFRISINHGKE